MACDLQDKLCRYKGQPVEFITKSGFKYCGILVDSEDNYADIIDKCGRIVHIELRNVESFIEPRMKLHKLCANNDCCCSKDDDDDCCCDD